MQNSMKKRTLDAFKIGDEIQLHMVAKELYESGFFNCYLTPQQFNLLNTLLNQDKEIWAAFMHGSLILRFKEDDGDDSNSNENMYLKPGFPTLRNLNSTIRYLLYEQAVDYFFSHNSSGDNEFELLEKIATEHPYKSEDSDHLLKDEDKRKQIDTTRPENEEDNYDDDEDDDYDNDEDDNDATIKDKQVDEKQIDASHKDHSELRNDLLVDETTQKYVLLVSKEELLKKPLYPSVSELSADEDAIGSMVHPILGTSSAIESNIEKQNELKLIKNFNKVYHSFENDLPNIHKKRKLERSNKQIEMSENKTDEKSTEVSTTDSDTKQVNKLMSLGGAANLSLKNLLNKIEVNRDQLGLTDIELKNLIMDVRKNRSKWANYNKIGQEELYEACEKVVTELRAYTEHSTPFLNRVSKREAPNYYQIIKHPMDLNTVLKKLKTLQYTNKQQFVDDLMLIWQNCLTYNSDPKHYLRLDAIAMRKKTMTLIPLIPDITVRDRAEVEREAAEMALKEKEKESTEVGRKSTRGMGNKSTKKGRKNESDNKGKDDNITGNTLADTPSSIATPMEESTGEQESKDSINEASAETNSLNTSVPAVLPDKISEDVTEPLSTHMEEDEDDENIEEDKTRGINIEDINEDNDDLEMSTWKTLTSNTRYKLCNERSGLFKENKLQPNTEAPLRTKSQMYNFQNYLEDESKLVLHRNKKYFNENDDPYLIEYDVVGGVPNIRHKTVDFDKLEEQVLEDMISEGKTLEDLNESGMKVKVQGSNSLILENIGMMQDIRKVCFKINLIRTMQSSQFVHQSQFVSPNYPKIKFEDIDPMSKLPTRDLMNQDIASQSLQKSVSAMLMLNGFEATAPLCARLLTQIAQDYMCNLGKSLKLHLESKSINKIRSKENKPLTYRDTLKLVLKANGVDKPDIIYSYYKEQLGKQNKKLIDLKYGLENFLRDLLRPSMQDLSETQFNDDSEQFVNGDFSDEIGEDFFGFKELGLDREFGLLTSNIPLHLLQSKLSYQFSQMNKHMAKRIYEDFQEVDLPKLRRKDIPSQIGLLQPFYDDLLEKSKTHYAKQLKKYQTQKSSGEPVDEQFEEIHDDDDLILIEDDDLPLKQRNNRPKIPPNGKITQTKKKLVVNSFFIDDLDTFEEKLPGILQKYEEEARQAQNKREMQNIKTCEDVGEEKGKEGENAEKIQDEGRKNSIGLDTNDLDKDSKDGPQSAEVEESGQDDAKNEDIN